MHNPSICIIERIDFMTIAVIHIGKYIDGLDRICNHDCIFCMERMEHGLSNNILPSVNEIKYALDRFTKVYGNINKLYLAGGEPTLRNDIYDIIKMAKFYASNIVLSTNCDYEDYKTIDYIENSGIREIATSLHGHNGYIHDYITQSAGSFERTVDCIDMFKKKNIAINLNCVFCSVNIEHMPRMVNFIKDISPLNKVTFTHFIFHGNAYYNKKLLFDIDKKTEIVYKSIELIEKNNLNIRFRDFPFCTDKRMKNHYEDISEIMIIPTNKQSVISSERAPFIEKVKCKTCNMNDICPKYIQSNYKEGLL